MSFASGVDGYAFRDAKRHRTTLNESAREVSRFVIVVGSSAARLLL